MTAVDVDALEAAQAGENLALPWHVDPYDGQRIATSLGGGVCSTYLPGDAALIVAAVNALPDLLAEVRRGRALREAVEGLADLVEQGRAWTGDSLARRLRAVLAAVDAS